MNTPRLKLSDLSNPIETFVLSNGLSVVVHSFPFTAVGLSFLVRCGPIFETLANNGISHFLEHMLFRGIPQHSSSTKLGLALDRVGAESNAATFTDMTILTHKVLPEALEEGMRIMKSMITQPVFSGLSAERRIILEECLEDVDEDGQIIAMDQLSSQLLYSDHPYSYSILGSPESVSRISRRQLSSHLRRYYRPSAGVICLSGQIQTETAKRLVQKVFGDWEEPADAVAPSSTPPIPEFHGPEVLVVTSARSQVQARISFKGVSFSDPDFYKMEAITRIIDCGSGSPLRQVMQDEMGFCYSLGTGTDAYECAGAIHIDFSVAEEHLVDAIRRSLNVFSGIARDGFPRSTIKHMIEQYVKNKRFSANDLWDFSGRFGFKALYPSTNSFEQELEKNQTITAADLRTMAHRIFAPRNLGLTLVGTIPKKSIVEIRRLLQDYT